MVLAVGVSQTWFRAGRFIAQGDIPPFVHTALEGEYTWAWNHELTGAGSPSFQVVRAAEVLVTEAGALFGGDDVTAQRVYYALLVGFVVFGAACFARRFSPRPGVVAVAALFACVNPFLLTQLPNPLVLVAIGTMGYAGSLVVGAAQGGRCSPLAFAVGTVAFAPLLMNVPLLVVAVGFVLLLVALGNPIGGIGGARRALLFVLRAAPWAFFLNVWWLVPAALTFLGSGSLDVAVSSDIRAWTWTHERASVANVLSLNGAWGWKYPEYFPFAARLDRPSWGWLRFVAPLACLVAPVVAPRGRRRPALVLLGVGLLLVMVGKGVHSPLGDLNLWLYDNVPGFWLLREPFTKVGAPLVLVYVALIAVVATAVLDRVPAREGARRLTLSSSAIGAVALLAYPYPLWNGGLFPESKPVLPSAHVRIPDGWRAAASHLNSQAVRGKALVLPLADYYQMPTTWGYYGADVVPKILLRRPTIQPVPETYYREGAGFSRAVAQIEEELLTGGREVAPLLRTLGVSHVLLRRDLDSTYPGRTFNDPRRMAPALSELTGTRAPRSFGVVDVYDVSTVSPGLVRAKYATAGGAGAGTGPALDWRRRNPATYTIRVDGAGSPFTVVLAEAYDSGWQLDGLPPSVKATHRQVDGYANGWLIEGGGDLRITARYAPANGSRMALRVSLAASVVALAVGGWRVGGHRRRGPVTAATPREAAG